MSPGLWNLKTLTGLIRAIHILTPHDPSKWIPKWIVIPRSGRPLPRLVFFPRSCTINVVSSRSRALGRLEITFYSTRYGKKHKSGRVLPVFRIKIPFGINLLGSWGGRICIALILHGQPNRGPWTIVHAWTIHCPSWPIDHRGPWTIVHAWTIGHHGQLSMELYGQLSMELWSYAHWVMDNCP